MPVDVLVVGAGPGGSNAAAAALDGGLSVVQVDSQAFPRTKPCAGGMTRRACRSLLFDLGPTLRREFPCFEFNLWSKGKNVFSERSGVLSMVARPEFDADLVRQNRLRPGFRFFDGERVRNAEWTGVLFRVQTDQRVFEAAQLVAADGANGILNRVFRIAEPKARATAIEVDLPQSALRPCFDFGALPRGYGWVFPKDDHSSVGLYTLERGIKDLRARLADYARAKGFALDDAQGFRAHTVPVGGWRLRSPRFPVYVVGDAGGFADALTGEGIYHALESGRLAGETAVEVKRGRADHHRYYRRLWRRVLPDTLLSFLLARWFYGALDASLWFLRNPLVWRPLVVGFARGATLCECAVRSPLYFVQSFAVGGAALRRQA